MSVDVDPREEYTASEARLLLREQRDAAIEQRDAAIERVAYLEARIASARAFIKLAWPNGSRAALCGMRDALDHVEGRSELGDLER